LTTEEEGMRQISFGKKMEALELYLRGFSTNEIVDKTGISKGAVIIIIKDAREGKFPQLELKERIDELHSLSLRLRKEGLDLTQAKLGFTFFRRLWDIDVEPEKVKEWAEFCSEISPSPPEGFIPAAIELFHIEKETGKGYSQIAAEAKELYSQREKLTIEVGDLKAKEGKAKELKGEVEESEEKVQKLRLQKEQLEKDISSLNSFLQKKAEGLGIPLNELEAKIGELVLLENEVSNRAKEKNRLEGEIEALSERQEKLSSRVEKAFSDFEKDIKLIRETSNELAKIAAMKGRYEKEMGYLEWAIRVLPFLSDPDKVSDDDFSLISIVINCVDKWIQTQPEWQYSLSLLTWDNIKRHIQTRRSELG
jgi:DNA repair exonuclease SbcCD ATPase subunit